MPTRRARRHRQSMAKHSAKLHPRVPSTRSPLQPPPQSLPTMHDNKRQAEFVLRLVITHSSLRRNERSISSCHNFLFHVDTLNDHLPIHVSLNFILVLDFPIDYPGKPLVVPGSSSAIFLHGTHNRLQYHELRWHIGKYLSPTSLESTLLGGMPS